MVSMQATPAPHKESAVRLADSTAEPGTHSHTICRTQPLTTTLLLLTSSLPMSLSPARAAASRRATRSHCCRWSVPLPVKARRPARPPGFAAAAPPPSSSSRICRAGGTGWGAGARARAWGVGGAHSQAALQQLQALQGRDCTGARRRAGSYSWEAASQHTCTCTWAATHLLRLLLRLLLATLHCSLHEGQGEEALGGRLTLGIACRRQGGKVGHAGSSRQQVLISSDWTARSRAAATPGPLASCPASASPRGPRTFQHLQRRGLDPPAHPPPRAGARKALPAAAAVIPILV